MRHFLSLLDLNRDELLVLLKLTGQLKRQQARGKSSFKLAGKVVGLVFEKPSLRTRVSFEAAMAQLGGSTVFLPANEAGLGTRETIPDFARTLCQYCDAIVLRTFAHSTVEKFAEHATVPIINGLTDYLHPCQALADLFTIHEHFGKLDGRTVVFVGDGNNVARSLAMGCGMLGIRFILAAPSAYRFDEPFRCRWRESFPNGFCEELEAPLDAVANADVIYTDVWTSMGQEAEQEVRRQAFATFQVNESMLRKAPKHAVVMHCLPAHRGEEIAGDVLDGPRSIAFQQAGNRLHAQKALLQWLLSPTESAGKKQRSR